MLDACSGKHAGDFSQYIFDIWNISSAHCLRLAHLLSGGHSFQLLIMTPWLVCFVFAFGVVSYLFQDVLVSYMSCCSNNFCAESSILLPHESVGARVGQARVILPRLATCDVDGLVYTRQRSVPPGILRVGC